MTRLPLFVSFLLLMPLAACPGGDNDAGVVGDGDEAADGGACTGGACSTDGGDGDEEVDGGACAGGACSTDGGPVRGDGDGDEEVDGGACAGGACSTDGGPVRGDVDAVTALIGIINDYREDNGLPRIPMSPKLNLVAGTHVDNHKYAIDAGTYGVDDSCNLHTWYDQPGQSFTSCCYTSDHAQAQCMWDKPDEIANFNTDGFEISAAGYGSIEQALVGWQNSAGHNAVILNEGQWASFPFQSIGAGVDEVAGIYHVWFATAADPDSP